MKLKKYTHWSSLLLIVAFGLLAACDDNEVEDAAEETGEALEEVAEETGEAAEEAADEVEEGVDEAT